MNNVLLSKVLSPEEVTKLVDEFDADDFAMRDDAEIKAFVSLLIKESKVLSDQRDEAIRASGSAEITSKIARVDGIVKSLLGILGSRTSSEEVDDKTVVCLQKDEEVVVSDDEGDRVETQTVEEEKLLFYTEVTYSVPSAAVYNEAAGTNLSEEDFFYRLLCKLHDLNLDGCIVYARVKFSALDASVVTDIIERNKTWHLLLNALSISKASLNSLLKTYPEKRQELLSSHFIVDEKVSKTKVPGSTLIQGTLFDFNDYVEVNLLTDGGNANE